MLSRDRLAGVAALPTSYLVVYAVSLLMALMMGNWLRPLSSQTGPALESAAWDSPRIQECKRLGDVYAAKLGDPEPYTNDFNASLVSPVAGGRDGTFLKLAMKAGTDKVTRHSYHYMYTKHLAHVRFNDLNILELGLGCGMRTGAGNSLKVWRSYMPCAKISFLEHMKDCAEKWRDEVEKESGGKLYIGEQNDAATLESIVKDAKSFGGFDMIVDDGAHFTDKQFFALDILWAAVKPGGIYVVEDFYKYFDETVDLTVLPPPVEPLPLFQRLLLTMNCDTYLAAAYRAGNKKWCKEHQDKSKFRNVVNVDCMAEACAITKGRPLTGF